MPWWTFRIFGFMHVIDINRTETTFRNEALDRWINAIRPYKVLTVNEEEDVIRSYKEGDTGALEVLIRGNQRFLLSVAKTYSRDPNRILELISEGNIGLLDAIEKYDLTYGIRFLSFAVHYIRRQICDYFNRNSLVKHRINSSARKYMKEIAAEWFEANGYEIPDWLLAEMVGDELGREFRDGALYLAKTSVYFDEDMGVEDNDGISVIEKKTCVQNDIVDQIEYEDIRTIAEDLLDSVCKTLTERDIVVKSYGLFGETQLSDIEIARIYKLAPRQVEYLRNKMLRRMKEYIGGKQLKFKKSKFQNYDEIQSEQNVSKKKKRGKKKKKTLSI